MTVVGQWGLNGQVQAMNGCCGRRRGQAKSVSAGLGPARPHAADCVLLPAPAARHTCAAVQRSYRYCLNTHTSRDAAAANTSRGGVQWQAAAAQPLGAASACRRSCPTHCRHTARGRRARYDRRGLARVAGLHMRTAGGCRRQVQTGTVVAAAAAAAMEPNGSSSRALR